MKIFLKDSFDSAHFLPNVPEGHRCKNLHGHTYKIKIMVAGPIDPILGWVIDYAEVKAAWCPIKEILDHTNINEVPGLENSTCENLARWIWSHLKVSLPGLCTLELRETANCGVFYAGEDE